VKAASKKTELERQQETKEKTGVHLDGVMAVNPATGEKIPMYIADYVLAHYGTGAIMAVPAHDERDYAFAKKFELPIKEVVETPQGAALPYAGDGILKDSGKFSSMKSDDIRSIMGREYGRLKKTYRLRDWIVSRQRYWGVPIPIVHCAECGAQPVPVKQLPVELPPVEDYLPDGNGKSPLAKVKEFVEVKCPKCGGKAQRETDTLDTFVDSSWYFLRYIDPKNNKAFASKAKLAKWMPVDLYSGGAEHTTMHVLYSRFWQKALYDMDLVADKEPYARRMNRSIILGPDGQKMSKSHGNVIDPDEVVERLGADTVRMYLAFVGPYNEVSAFPWNPDGVVGVRRFLERVWKLQDSGLKGKGVAPIFHKAIKKVGEDILAMKFNTAISQLMVLLNDIEKRDISQEEWELFLTMLAPFAPHMAEELWSMLGHKKSVHTEPWPAYDEAKLVDDEVTYGIQVDGKTRGEVRMPMNSEKSAVEAAARSVVASRLEGKEIARVIVVPNRLVNFVMKN
jgi:leucyl-tRNA synthetase